MITLTEVTKTVQNDIPDREKDKQPELIKVQNTHEPKSS